MARLSKADRLADKRVERAYYANCSGIQINVMDIGKVFARGREIVASGADDAALGEQLKAFVLSIAQNTGNTFQVGRC